MFRINGEPVFELREKDSEQAEVERASDVFRVGGSSGAFRIERFRLWRDLYYLPGPSHLEVPEEVKLVAGEDEYIVLGDNSPVSLDSRTWKSPGVSRSNLIGRLLAEE